jgi:hypothetical protein
VLNPEPLVRDVRVQNRSVSSQRGDFLEERKPLPTLYVVQDAGTQDDIEPANCSHIQSPDIGGAEFDVASLQHAGRKAGALYCKFSSVESQSSARASLSEHYRVTAFAAADVQNGFSNNRLTGDEGTGELNGDFAEVAEALTLSVPFPLSCPRDRGPAAKVEKVRPRDVRAECLKLRDDLSSAWPKRRRRFCA